jgi:hypothetical protein
VIPTLNGPIKENSMSAITASQPVCPHVKTRQVLVGVEFSRHIRGLSNALFHNGFPEETKILAVCGESISCG